MYKLTTAALFLTGRPTAIVSPPVQVANIGDTVTFQCEAEGDGDIDIAWRQTMGEELPSGVEQVQTDLVISDIDPSHAGTYTCVVSNLAGENETTAVLNVFCKFSHSAVNVN